MTQSYIVKYETLMMINIVYITFPESSICMSKDCPVAKVLLRQLYWTCWLSRAANIVRVIRR